MNLAVEISLYYLSQRHSCLQVLKMHRVRRINMALVILILSHVLQAGTGNLFLFCQKKDELQIKIIRTYFQHCYIQISSNNYPLRLGAQSVTLLSTLRDPTQLRRHPCATRQQHPFFVGHQKEGIDQQKSTTSHRGWPTAKIIYEIL